MERRPQQHKDDLLLQRCAKANWLKTVRKSVTKRLFECTYDNITWATIGRKFDNEMGDSYVREIEKRNTDENQKSLGLASKIR